MPLKEDKDNSIINIIDAGPSEFLGWFLDASFVLTTSFHGVCFSLNFNVPFYSILKKGKTNNSRQINLLSELNLGSRILFVEEAFPENDYVCDFENANLLLKEKTNSSLNYLKKAIEE